MDERYMDLFLKTGNPVFYTAAKTAPPNDNAEEQTPPKAEG